MLSGSAARRILATGGPACPEARSLLIIRRLMVSFGRLQGLVRRRGGAGHRCRQGRAAGRSPCAAPRPYRRPTDAGFRKERLQARHFRKDGTSLAVRRASFVSRRPHSAAPAGLEPRLPRTAIAARGHFRPAQLFRARFGRSARARSRSQTASRAARAPAPTRGTTGRHYPRPASSPKSSSRTTMRTNSAW